MRYRTGRPGAAPVTVSNDELWQRLGAFLRDVVPVAEEAGVILAAHPDDPPAEALRGAARLVNRPEKYDRLMDIVDPTDKTIDALTRDPHLMDRSGRIWIGAELAQQYGIHDVDGRQPPSHRPMLGDPPVFSAAVIA